MNLSSSQYRLRFVGGLAFDKKGKPGVPRVYCFDLQRETWVRSAEILTRERREHVGFFDPAGRRHVIFGGQSIVEEGNFYKSGTPFDDTIAITVRRVEKE